LNKQNSPAYSGNVAGRRKEENEEMTETVMLATATAIPPDSPNPTQLPKGNRKKIVAKKNAVTAANPSVPPTTNPTCHGWLVDGGQEDRQASRGHSPTTFGEFDDYLPCHVRQFTRSSSSRTDIERTRQHPVVVISTSATQHLPGVNHSPCPK
jgi:hypothetical protein